MISSEVRSYCLANGAEEEIKDFFISYNRADRAWAEWIAWQLEEAGYSVTLQAWDFGPGSDFIQEMDSALKEAQQTIAVLSPNYLQSKFAGVEWHTALAEALKREECKLLPVLVRECELKGLLSIVVYIDLVGKEDEAWAKDELLRGVKIARGERGKPQTAPSFPRAVQRSITKQPRFPEALPPIWNVPHNRNPNFTGRESLLTDLRTSLTSGQSAALTQAISGLGGVGKTQLAVEYAYRHAAEYEVVWWVRSEEPATLASDYGGLAQELGLPEKGEKDQQVTVQAVRRWLGQNKNWLLVLDNADDPTNIHDYLPQGITGHVLVTSRNPNWGGVAIRLSVKKFERTESIKFLCKRTGQTDEITANKLAEELGDLPLALAQAGAYIEATSTTFAAYLKLFQSRRNELWKEEKSPIDYTATVATAWSLSMGRVREESLASEDLLNLCAYLGPDDIPLALLNERKEHLPHSLSSIASDGLARNRTISILRRYSLIEVTGDTLFIHRLVQAVVRDRMTEEEKRTWAEIALHLVNVTFESYSENVKNWTECSRLLPHAFTVTRNAEELGVACEVVADLLNIVAAYLTDHGQFEKAEAVFLQALKIRERIHGIEHSDVAQSLNDLGVLYENKGEYEKAESLHKRAEEIYEKAYGPNHPHIATPLNNLAVVYRSQRKYDEAEPLYKRTLQIFEESYGPVHPDVATCLTNLAELNRAQGKLEEAEAHCKRALQIFEENLLSEHINTAACLNNLALIYHCQARYTEAEPLYERAKGIWEKVLGPNHPNLAKVLINMSDLYEKTGRQNEAKKLRERAKAIRSRNQS